MSENIVHIGIVDDCFRLMLASDSICPAFKEVATEHRRFAHLGAITRKGDMFTYDLLERMRRDWDQRKPEEKLDAKLAFVLGWLCHRAADRQMKPIFRAVDANSGKKPTDCSIYQEAFIYHELYAQSEDNPYHAALFEKDMSSLPAAATLSVDDVKDLFRTLLQGSLIELHTFIPDVDDIEGWLEKLFDVQQRFYNDLDRYAEAIHRPDPDKVRRFIEEVDFYNPEDSVIAAARSIQRGEPVDDVEAAWSTEARSHYAQALQLGMGYLDAASAYFTNNLSLDELKERFKIGKAGRDGKSV